MFIDSSENRPTPPANFSEKSEIGIHTSFYGFYSLKLKCKKNLTTSVFYFLTHSLRRKNFLYFLSFRYNSGNFRFPRKLVKALEDVNTTGNMNATRIQRCVLAFRLPTSGEQTRRAVSINLWVRLCEVKTL
ncbi:uncharacterized protein LOC144646656 isoform X1 [Oculina patagonica]